MAFVAVPDTAKCEILAEWMGHNIVNVIHLGENGDASQAHIQTMADTAWTAWHDHFRTAVVTGFTVKSIRVTDISSQTGPQAEHVADIVGTDGNPPGPVERCCVIGLHTATRARYARGRVFMAGFEAAKIAEDGTVDPAWRSALEDGWGAFNEALDAGTTKLVVASRKHGQAYPVTTYKCAQVAGIQRRRLH